jgi:Ca2+-binding EF-hand superfamily protein
MAFSKAAGRLFDPDQFGLSQSELADAQDTGLTLGEIAEACHLFRVRLANSESRESEALPIEDIDLLLRQLRLFLPVRCLWALFEEIDKNADGQIGRSEFILMVAKLRGKSKMSNTFYVNSVARSAQERYTKVFEILSGEDKLISLDDLITSSRQLNSHVDTDSDEFRKALEELNHSTKTKDARYSLTDFLTLESKLRKPPPEIEVSLLSLTEEESKRFSDFYGEWRKASIANTTPQELRVVLHQLGHQMTLEQVRRVLQNAEVDGSRPIRLNEFLYILVSLGAGTSDRRRCILLPGASYEDAFKLALPLEEIWELGYEDLVQIRRAGWSAQSVVKAGLGEAWQLRQVGYGSSELRKIGMPAKQLKLAGFSLEELRNAGFSHAALRDCCSVLSRNRAHRQNEESSLTLRPSEHSPTGPHPLGPIFDQGGQHGERRWWATPRIKTMLDGPPGAKGVPGPKRSSVKVRPVTR